MDLVDTLRSKIDTLADGEYTAGLRAVLAHIETAFAHLRRGQDQNDETAFTDVIYRCNQAFEGSIKEAYRVLASKDPNKKTLHKIEGYLEDNDIFRERVLSQFNNYRTEWRNPSTHDYKLDFDDSESFLAIVSVSAFACVLIDQIARQLAFANAVKSTDTKKNEIEIDSTSNEDLPTIVTNLCEEFSKINTDPSSVQTELQLMGALTGFITTVMPNLETTLDYRLSHASNERGDLLIANPNDRVLIELKRTNKMKNVVDGVAQLTRYLALTGLKQGVLFAFPPGGGPLKMERHFVEPLGATVTVLRGKNI
ncbi:GxxExxY protein [Leptothoe kymatousa]|uniref:Uncharacterized protein n=1 Tax=Leptothoe kymatousa TAU-MAC 1615 TaxID=2364775 RepID=A0ABS5Y2F7_9CYAN|nr:GxxExxY protein [Leptothoe kymatousa]MBT9312020.1 hypothetical protein [Leptothoe kymatousa TAU-MAC 1615]